MKSGFRTALVLIVLSIGVPTAASAQDVERGRELFQLCASCHGAAGGGNPL